MNGPDTSASTSWDADEIREFYDMNPVVDILTLAGMTGLTGSEVKAILMNEDTAQ